MRIENITKKKLTAISYKELEDTRMRIVQQWDRYFKDSKEDKIGTLDRGFLVEKYKLLVRERVKNRHILLKTAHAIDQYIFDISMFKLSVPNLGEMVVIPDFCSLAGSFVKNPQEADDIEIVIKLSGEKKNEDLERELGGLLASAIKRKEGKKERKIEFIYCAAGPDSSYIPLYDFVLKPKEKTEVKRIKKSITEEGLKEKISIKKPEENKDRIRIPVSPECKVTATITISEDEGITALYCGEIKRIRTFIFDKKKKAWTMSSAKAWIKEHKEKVNKQLEESLETFEYLIHHIAVEGDKETIHHCYLYDHIGNLYEQSHLWIEKGKIYLDGKEIKEGHYHVIKGLEETQEVAWSEEEAAAADIKPKQMKSGMTLKEKAKEW